jgi:hypothetical protein
MTQSSEIISQICPDKLNSNMKQKLARDDCPEIDTTLPEYRLTTGWMVRGSNPGGGAIFRTRPDRPWGPPSLLYKGYRVFPGDKSAGAWCWPPTPF